MSPMLKRITEEDARQARREIICEIAEAVFLLGALVASIWIVLAVTGGNSMKWTSEKPKRAGYYWYLGPVMKRDFDRVKNGSDIRDCTWGPIIAGVGIFLKEIPSGDGNPHHEKMWNEGRIVVEFYGSTVRRTLAEMPREVLWAGPVTPPVSDWAWHLQPKDKIQAKPFEAEIDASEITAWSVRRAAKRKGISTRMAETNTLTDHLPIASISNQEAFAVQ